MNPFPKNGRSVEVRISALVLDGVELHRRERDALPLAVREALAELLTPSSGGPARPPHTNSAVDPYPRTARVEAIAGQIATAVHGGLPATAIRPRRRGGRR